MYNSAQFIQLVNTIKIFLQIAGNLKVTTPALPTLPKNVSGYLGEQSMNHIRTFTKAFEESQKLYALKVDIDDADSPVGKFIFISSFFIEKKCIVQKTSSPVCLLRHSNVKWKRI